LRALRARNFRLLAFSCTKPPTKPIPGVAEYSYEWDMGPWLYIPFIAASGQKLIFLEARRFAPRFQKNGLLP